MLLNINKFNFVQLFNDSQGKTSLTLFVGFLAAIASLGGFIVSGNTILIMVIFKLEKNGDVINFMQTLNNTSLALFTVAASMITAHRLSKDKPVTEEAKQEESKSEGVV